MRLTGFKLALSIVGAIAAPATANVVDHGGAPAITPSSPCISPAERAWAESAVRAYRAANPVGRVGAGSGAGGETSPAKLPFYPMGGALYRDVYTNNFVDIDPSTGFKDFNCTNHSYNGHLGIDTDLRSFAEQEVGVPVFSALDGTVVAMHDGEFDMNTSCEGEANSVIIDHGLGRFGYYWHLKNGSVQASASQLVRAGRQIGEVGSSGCSTGPHLHFEVHDDGTFFEPYAGACRDGESEWIDQEPIRWDTYLRDLGVTHENLSGHPGWPHAFPRSGQIAKTDPFTRIWFIAHNLPADSTRQWQFVRPDGTVSWTSPVAGWENPPYRWSWWWFSFSVNEMRTITGTWTVRLEINGEQEAEFPIEVVNARDPGLNRAPKPVTIELAPYAPDKNTPITAQVLSDLVVDDVDYDVVRYHYVWMVDDRVVRDVTTAAQGDVFPAGMANFGTIVTCTVTPDDGALTAASASADVAVRSTCSGDLNDNRVVDVEDVILLLPHWGPCDDCLADIDGNAVVDVADVVRMLAGWGECP